MNVFTGQQQVNFSYYQYFLVLVFSLSYFVYHVKKASKYHKRIFFSTICFLLVLLFFPIFKGLDINQTVRIFSVNYTSLIILPISFHYYSQKGNILNLLRSGYYFILLWVSTVLFFTLFKIDVTAEHMGLETFGGGIFYFGNMSRRGAITYISFALLLAPLIFNYISYKRKIALLASSGFLLSIMFTALKRFSFVVVILGLFNYLVKSSISLKIKIGVVFGAVTIVVLLFSTTNLKEITLQSYKNRGGESIFGAEAIEGDLRLYEPLYVSEYVFSGTIQEILFGKKQGITMDIESTRHTVEDRKIHNQYAEYILIYGMVGLVAYLAIFLVLYKITYRFRKDLIKNGVNVNEYWIVFQNLVFIFIVAGMVGGHVHVTFRSMVLLYAGGISGYLYKMVKYNSDADKSRKGA